MGWQDIQLAVNEKPIFHGSSIEFVMFLQLGNGQYSLSIDWDIVFFFKLFTNIFVWWHTQHQRNDCYSVDNFRGKKQLLHLHWQYQLHLHCKNIYSDVLLNDVPIYTSLVHIECTRKGRHLFYPPHVGIFNRCHSMARKFCTI